MYSSGGKETKGDQRFVYHERHHLPLQAHPRILVVATLWQDWCVSLTGIERLAEEPEQINIFYKIK